MLRNPEGVPSAPDFGSNINRAYWSLDSRNQSQSMVFWLEVNRQHLGELAFVCRTNLCYNLSMHLYHVEI
jgi:hypothetical protein